MIADFFMRVNSVTWSIVSGICQNRLVIVFRNDGIRKNAGRVAQKSFSDLGSAGGHKNMARCEISVSDLKVQVEYEDENKLLNWMIRQVEQNAGKK